ncbi:MAG: hypothetical protein IPI48_02740 [bacterium]|nr:hypothetical protein [bacterium]
MHRARGKRANSTAGICIAVFLCLGAFAAGAGTVAPPGFAALTVAGANAGPYIAIINWDLDGYAEPMFPNGTPGAWWWASAGTDRIRVRHFIGPAAVPMTLTMLRNAFNSSVRLTIEGSLGGTTSLRIYDRRGQFVRRLATGDGGTLPLTLLWDGRDQGGSRLTAGTYYVVLGVGDQWLAQTIAMTP